ALDEAVQRLKGPKGTQVRITIVRRGLEEPLEFTVTRAEIPQTTVRYAYMIAPGTGYLSIADFARTTGSEVARALADLRAAGMQRLLVDLRNNGGGLLDQAIEVADQFLPAGATIVETRGRVADSQQRFTAGRKGEKLDLPVVVLVNNGTASAAEILAGAIQDHDLGLVVGTPTWGKGLVQTVYNLSYGAGLALTTAKYYTPSGRLIQRDYSSYWDYYTRAEEDAGGGEAGSATRRPPVDDGAYATDLGRTVYGGGGIAPDVEVELDELPEYLQFLFARNAFFNFALEIERRHLEGSEGIGPEWRPEPGLIDEFARWLVEQQIDRAEDVARGLEPAASREVVARQLRSEVLTSRLGLQAAHAALAEGDAQIRAALGLFDQATELRTRRAGLAADGPAPRAASLR
ncbi:MAG TPA: S41 family peptidase, partial [Thermoanaerobaculia bacterium]|nr:S41 family peptidase [Thermoanaerobaculia bacterium]